jgi:hypothetical protein
LSRHPSPVINVFMRPVFLADAYDTTIGAVIFAAATAFIVGIFVLAIRQQKAARENLRKLADRLGLVISEPKKSFFSSSTPRATGNMRGRTVTVWSYTTGSGKNRVQWCAISASARNTSRLTLRVSGENFFTRVGRAFGADDVKTDDPAFDERFYVKSNDASYIRAAFISEVRARFTEAWQTGARRTVSDDGDEVKYAEHASYSRDKVCARFPALAELVCDVADVVETRV